MAQRGAASIATLTSKHIARWRDDVAKDYAPTTVNFALGCLSSAFSWFAERWLAANPCDGVKQREVPDRAYKWIRTRGELERLLLASSEELCDMIAVSVATMLRIDELLHLQHDDIDLDARLITAQRAAGHHQEREGPPRADRGLGARRPPAPPAEARCLAARVPGQGRPGARSEPRDVRVQGRAA